MEANLLGMIHDMKYTFFPMDKMVYVWQLLESLDEVENGFQIFYRCLRETRDGCNEHADVMNDLEFTGESYMVVNETQCVTYI